MIVVRVVRELKRDVFGRVELVERGSERRVRRVTSGSRLPLSCAIARVLAARERKALERLDGASGAPRLELEPSWAAAAGLDGATPQPRDVLVRTWIEGEPLSKAHTLPENFFDLLHALVCDVHALGVCHNDLHKEQNVVVQPDGRPALVDFQLASVHRVGSYLWRSRAAEDLRHVEKHRRRYMRVGRGPIGSEIDLERSRKPRRSTLAWIWRRAVKPLYNFATRRVLRWRDFEERRQSTDAWPRWTPPV
jgi:predicted Ser/Thr protein kinase